MADIDWQRQSPDKPLFADLLWSKPENKAQSGKLLIVGGNLNGFSSVAEAFTGAEKAGIGTVQLLLPDKLQKTLSKAFPEADFAPSTLSGSFGRQTLDQLLESARWADGVLLAGDFSKNSETAIVLESFLDKYKGSLVLSGDSLDYFLESPSKLLNRQNTAILADFGRLQAMAKFSRRTTPLTHDMGLYELVKALAQWSEEIKAAFITYHQGNIAVSTDGQISTTPVKSVSLPGLSAYPAVWLIQNPEKHFEALTTANYAYLNQK